jgi:hypothetical protein
MDSPFDFNALLQQALTVPGLVNQAYRTFHHFSLGNQILAALQLTGRGLPLSPIASFNTWKEKGRFVRKGQKAISLFMPVTVKTRKTDRETGEAIEAGFTQFTRRPYWFSLEQTEGTEFIPEDTAPQWDATKAMQALAVEEIHFHHLNGNVMGYASGRNIAINPLNPIKHKTRFHELAHIVLGHTTEGALSDGVDLPKSIKEAEAEGTAYILCSLLDLPGQAESRAYIQGWMKGAELPEASARRIFGAAEKIIKAGQ